MITTRNLLHAITDNIDEGIIYIDKNEELKLFNLKAKEIMGVVLDHSLSHPGGRIEPGDIVVITDNAIGDDDGGLKPKDLELIGLCDPEIRENDMVIAVGVYKNPEIKAEYKYLRNHELVTTMTLDTHYLGFHITAEIHSADSYMNIKVNNTVRRMNFLKSIGHAVIIDGKNGQIKFFQDKGYTVRREPLAHILHGKTFLPKGSGIEDMEPIGKKLSDIAEKSELTDTVTAILKGEQELVKDQFLEINKRLTLCSVIPIANAEAIDGVLLKIKDASELEQMVHDRNRLLERVENRFEKRASFNADTDNSVLNDFVGTSYAMKEVKYLAYKASKAKFNVILTGESGTGKSRLAYEIHKLSNEKAPFVEVNCGSIPPNLFESELFGYAGGAFTGALDKGKAGYFELANGGTIFLDEIGEVPVEIQVKLLHVLQTKRFYRIGSSKPVDIDVRVITATNVDLQEAVKKGAFRQDLYYRINVFPIHVPPLRERKPDIYLLINRILKTLCSEYSLEEKQFSGAALNKMLNYDWPGNVRELENVIERAVTICDSNIIFPEYINIATEFPGEAEYQEPLRLSLSRLEKQIITETLRQCSGDKSKAIKILDVSKSVFYEKLKKYNIT